MKRREAVLYDPAMDWHRVVQLINEGIYGLHGIVFTNEVI